MLYREIMAFCSEIGKKLINTLCGLNVEFVNLWVCRDVHGFDGGLQVRHQKFLSLSAVFLRGVGGVILNLLFFYEASPSFGSRL
jgi:hypothetical protein